MSLFCIDWRKSGEERRGKGALRSAVVTTTRRSSQRAGALFESMLAPLILVGLWGGASMLRLYPESVFPDPLAVGRALAGELQSGRLLVDVVASVFRVSTGFFIAIALGIPIGMVLGRSVGARMALLPLVNFFRNISPLAWIPFAILWFGIGDLPSIFLILMAAIFPIAMSTCAAVSSVPSVYFRVARELGLSRRRTLWCVTLPAIAPQIITTLRVTAGLSWLVVVAAEMIAGRDGLGFAIWDARNGLRADLLASTMVIVGLLGVAIDRLLLRLTHIRSVRWGYDQ
jgi:NitT/TauT family transport system permease protein